MTTTALALFGSVLRDDFAPQSDVDVLVELAPNAGCSVPCWWRRTAGH